MAVAAKVRTGAVKGLTRSADIRTAVAAVQHVPAHIRPAVRRHIMRKAKGIKGASRHIPPHWHPSGAIRHVRPAQALALAEAAGVTLDLANDLDLAGKWKHGWIPLDAVAAAVKAKRYHGGATHEVSSHSGPIHVRNVRADSNNRNMAIATVVKDHRKGTASTHAPGESVWVAKAQVRPFGPPSKGRAGSAVEARREQSRGRIKGELPTRGRTFSDAGEAFSTRREHGLSTGARKAAKVTPVGSRLEHGEPQYVVPADHAAAARAAVRMRAPELRDRASKGDKIAQAELDRREARRTAGKPAVERVSATDLKAGDVLKSWRGGGKSDVGSSMRGSHVVAVDHRRGFAHVKLDTGFEVRLRHEDGTADRVAAARSAATERAQQVAQDRTRRVQNAQVAKDEAKVRALQASHPLGASVEARQPGIEKVTHGKVVGHDPEGMLQVAYKDRHGKSAVGRYNPSHVKLTAGEGAAGEKSPIEQARTADLRAEVEAFDANPPSARTTPSAEYRARVARYNEAKRELGRRQIPGARSGGTAGDGYNEAPAGRPKADAPPAESGAGGAGADVSRETSQASIRIEHSGDGTLVHGTERGDKEATAALKANGFKWSSNLGAWYLPRNWSESTRAGKVQAVQSALGDRVAVDRGSVAKSTTAAERAAERTRRDAELAALHTAKAGQLSAEADRRFGAASAIADHIPMGQPVLVGHHSEGRHRRDLARIDSNMRAGVAAHGASKDAAHRAGEAAARVGLATNPQALSRRIDRNSAELRKLDRILNGTGKAIHGQDAPHPPGEHRDRLEAMRAELADSIEHDRQTIAAAGAPQHGPATVKAGDYVRVRGSLLRVEKSNPKTITVKSHGLTLKYPYSEIQAHSTTENLLAKASDSQLQAFVYSKRGTPEAAVAQQILDERKRQAG